ncbi:MAG TPA: hypothetical protein VNQ77_10625 [Frankiaceae bacterium]|nr:hypothetical protein [Frankiaceae bacterium]
MRYAAVLAAVLALTACSGEADPGSSVPCDGKLKTAAADAALPARLPSGVESPVMYDTQKLGATSLWFGQAQGDDVVVVRDAISGVYEKGGFTIESRDEEPPAEAEFQWTNDEEEGSVQVTPLCAGHVTIRWRAGPR